MAEIFNTFLRAAKDVIGTVKSKAKLSTLFDLVTTKAIPAAVSEENLEEFYEQRMKDLYRVIYEL
ncbi:MAG TPA: hypothetical protein VKK79_00430 [Candidatus Lokiarchaeia archaeon]|nr:hypothetical protein [Candidatus Lokiarchaeia archaeon]